MMHKHWEQFFKPEIRNLGQRIYLQKSIKASSLSDVEIQAYVRGSSNLKVSLKSPAINSHLIIAACSCPGFNKGQFCKHIWGCLLQVAESFPDFLDEKSEIQKVAKVRNDKKEILKKKQNDYRKDQYQKQKQRIKDKKLKSASVSQISLPPEVEKAFDYFHQNGFAFDSSSTVESLQLAKKKLARVFHPDIGGTHQEIVQLNNNSEIVLQFLIKNS